MNGIGLLVGARIHAITFGVAHFQMQVSTDKDEFSISTSADVSCEAAGNDHTDFREDKNGVGLISLMGAELLDLYLHDLGRGASLVFDEDRRVRAWWPDKVYDSLFVVRNAATNDWWVIE